MAESFYDWSADQESGVSSATNPRNWNASHTGAMETRQAMNVNPVNGHARDCECSRCPAWYDARVRVAAEARFVSATPVVPAERQPRPLTDVVVPVCALLAMLTVCGVVLVPVVTPLIGLAAVSTVAVAVSVVALASVALVFLTIAMKLRRGFDREKIVRGRVVNR